MWMKQKHGGIGCTTTWISFSAKIRQLELTTMLYRSEQHSKLAQQHGSVAYVNNITTTAVCIP